MMAVLLMSLVLLMPYQRRWILTILTGDDESGAGGCETGGETAEAVWGETSGAAAGAASEAADGLASTTGEGDSGWSLTAAVASLPSAPAREGGVRGRV